MTQTLGIKSEEAQGSHLGGHRVSNAAGRSGRGKLQYSRLPTAESELLLMIVLAAWEKKDGEMPGYL